MMYQQFFGFKEPPFNLTPDSKFLFLSHRHQEALAAMLFGVQERKGFICLTGEIGCGKTTLCRALFSQLDPEQVKVCMVLNSYLTDLELLKTINEGFGLFSDSESKKTLLDALNNFLVDEFSKGHNIVLVIDESQNLRPETLEQVRMISNLETETDKLIQIMLIGQPELRRTLALPELEQLTQRITVRYHIQPLEEKEIGDYIKHRLSVAEPQVEVSFTPQAFRLVHHYSRGVPRRINVICDRCLLIAYTQGTFQIDDKIVQQAVDEVRGDSQSHGAASTAAGGLTPNRGGAGRLLATVGWMAAAAIVIAAGVYLGTSLSNRNAAKGAKAPKTPAQIASVPGTNTAFPTHVEPMEGVPANGTDAQPAATPAPTATPIPTPAATPFLYQDWQFDGDKYLRVQNESFAEVASYINLLSLWTIPIDPTLFQQMPANEFAQIDMQATVKQQLNFQAFTTDNLGEALRPDLPLLVQLNGGGQFASWAVVSSMSADLLTVIDPIHGKKTVRRSTLEPLVRKAIVMFRDTTGLAGIQPGEQSERVQSLQAYLAREGFYLGTADGKFGSQTNDALRSMQQKLGLEQSGVVDQATLAVICAGLNPRKPTLF